MELPVCTHVCSRVCKYVILEAIIHVSMYVYRCVYMYVDRHLRHPNIYACRYTHPQEPMYCVDTKSLGQFQAGWAIAIRNKDVKKPIHGGGIGGRRRHYSHRFRQITPDTNPAIRAVGQQSWVTTRDWVEVTRMTASMTRKRDPSMDFNRAQNRAGAVRSQSLCSHVNTLFLVVSRNLCTKNVYN